MTAALAAAVQPALPRVRLATLPTPLEAAPRLGRALCCPLLQIKREDLTGLAFGGNKPRQLEVILGAALARGADTVVTTAGAQSNFCRAMAAACAKLGLKSILLLRGDGSAPPTGNLLLDRLFGAEIHWIDTADPYDPRVRERLDALIAACPGRPWLVQLPGVTGALAAAAATALAEELAGQWAEPPRAVCLAVGSGLTAAGLLAGFARLKLSVRIVAISVQQPTGFIAPLIRRRAREALELLGSRNEPEAALLEVEDRFIGRGYGVPTHDSLDAVTLAARCEGLVLDPVYTGKALAGLAALLAEGRLDAGGPLVFVHSGGGPTLFAQTEALARHLGGTSG